MLAKTNNSLIRYFDDAFGVDFPHIPFWGESSFSTPFPVDIQETIETYDIAVSAPGMKKDDFLLTYENECIKLIFETENRFSSGKTKFSQTWKVPANSTEKDISAEYKNGILNIIVKKQKPVEIPIRTIKIK